MPTKEQWAYLAGLVDGEGCISIQYGKGRRNPTYSAKLVIAMTDYGMIEWLKNTFGCGSIWTAYRSKSSARPNWKDIHYWQLGSLAALDILRGVYPYLLLKREQAEAAIKLQEDVSARRHKKYLTVPELHLRESLKRKISCLKRKEYVHAV